MTAASPRSLPVALVRLALGTASLGVALVFGSACTSPAPSAFARAQDVSQGQEAGGPQQEAPPMRAPVSPPLRVDWRSSYLPERDFEDGRGDMSRYEVQLELQAGTPIGERSELLGRAGIGRIHYDFGDTGTELAPGDREPFERIDTYMLELGLRQQLTPEWTMQLRVQGDAAGAPGAHFDAAWSLSGSVDFAWAPGPNLLWIFGLGVQSRIEAEPLPFPRLGFVYRDEAWLAALYGPDLRVVRRLAPGLEVGIAGSFVFQDARLGPSAAVPEGVLRERFVVLGPVVTFRPARELELRADLGWTVYHEVELEDRFGHGGSRSDVEGGFHVRLGLEWTPFPPVRAAGR